MPLSLSPSLLMSSASSVAFSPLSLFASGEQGAWYDPSDLSTMFQDTAGTTPVTATGQTVARINDKSGRGNHATQATAASRPIYGIEPFGGRRNLLTQTETGVGWNADSTTFATGLPGVDGSTNGSFSFSNGTTNYPRAGLEVTSGVQVTCSAWLWVTAGSVTVRPAAFYSGAWQLLGSGDLTITSIPQRFTWTYTPASNTSFGSGFALRVIYSGGTGTVRVSGAQLELGSTATAYQRVTDQWNVTQAGVPSVAYVAFDGTDDGMVTNTITPGIDKAQVFAGVRKLSDAATGTVIDLNGVAATNAIMLRAPSGSVANYAWFSGGSLPFVGAVSANSFAAPITNVVTGIGDIAGDTAIFRVNGTQAAINTSDQGTGNYSANPLYIGRRGGTQLPFNGRIYGLAVRFGANLSAAQISQMETWLNARTGAF